MLKNQYFTVILVIIYFLANAQSGNQIVVKRGESLYDIAQKSGVSIANLIKINELKNTNLISFNTFLLTDIKLMMLCFLSFTTSGVCPSGTVVDREKILYRTTNQNVFIAFIQGVTRDSGQTKKRNSEQKFSYAALVESLGLLSKLNCF